MIAIGLTLMHSNNPYAVYAVLIGALIGLAIGIGFIIFMEIKHG